MSFSFSSASLHSNTYGDLNTLIGEDQGGVSSSKVAVQC